MGNIALPAYPKYGPVGLCIYCPPNHRAAEKNSLSSEHVIPKIFDGTLELKSASCSRHRDITSKVEQYVGRAMWGPFRLANGFRSRSKKERPLGLEIEAQFPDDIRKLCLRNEDYPAFAPILRMAEPMSVTGSESMTFNVSVASISGIKAEEIGAQSFIQPSHPLGVNTFAQLLAKIAHGLAVLKFGIDGFEHLLPEIIDDNRKNPFALVGGSLDDHPVEPSATHGHTHSFSFEYGKDFHGEMKLMTNLRLFSNWDFGDKGSPIYRIVTGQPNERTLARLAPGFFYPQWTSSVATTRATRAKS